LTLYCLAMATPPWRDWHWLAQRRWLRHRNGRCDAAAGSIL